MGRRSWGFETWEVENQALMEDNHQLITIISTLKMELKDVQSQFDSLSKSVKLFTLGTQSLDNLLSEGNIKGDKKKTLVF